MDSSSITLTSIDDQKLLELFLDNAELRKQRIFFSRFLGNPMWWVACRTNGKKSAPAILHPKCTTIWADPRLDDWKCKKEILLKIRSKYREPSAFQIECRKHRLVTYCIPLDVEGRRIGILGMSHLRPSLVRKAPLDLLNSMIRTLLVNTIRDYEFKRLSESVRPRAIALSTVHTVHRIINSTLNLGELVDRLAHLTAQVLRAKRCSIFLAELAQSPKLLIEKAKAGYPLKLAKRWRTIKAGERTEGRVFSSAKSVVRKNSICVPLIDEEVIGVISLSGKKDGHTFDAFDLEILTTLSEEAVIAINNAQLYEEQKKVTLGAIHSMAEILGARFAHTRKLPTETFLKIALSIAGQLKLSAEEQQAVHYAALLKDAGKIGMPDEILKKPTKLTGEEYMLMRQHPVKGAMIVQSFENLKPVAPIILYSHEHYDGSGYPHGLKGAEIPMGARILGVVNAFDALIAGRPYKTRATLMEAIQELKHHKGTQFDPRVVDALEHVTSKPPLSKLLGGI